MHLYILRHAHAAPLDGQEIKTDEDRPITDKGREQVRTVALAIKRMGIAVDLILTSPLRRAMETAELLSQESGTVPVEAFKRLSPGSPSNKLSKHLIGIEAEHVVLVGHEPDLSEHTAWFIGSKKASIKLAKGAIACVECEVAPGHGMGTLKWLMTPRTLASLLESSPDS